MGTWSNKPFGNDTALDWLAELNEAVDGVGMIEGTLKRSSIPGEISSDLAEEAVASAAIVAAASEDALKGIHLEAKKWIKVSGFSPTKQCKLLAINSIESVIKSELKDLWEEFGLATSWIKETGKIKAKLISLLDAELVVRRPQKIGFPRNIGKLINFYLKAPDQKIEKKIINKLASIEDVTAQNAISNYDLPLNLAAKSGLVEAINLLIAKGADPNAISLSGHRPLMLANSLGHINASEALIKAGANLFNKYPQYNEDGTLIYEIEKCTALHAAARKGHPELIDLIVSYGADIYETDLNGETLLHKSAESGNVSLLKYLIDSGLDVNQSKSPASKKSQGEFPLHYAVKANQLEAVKILLKCGADVNAQEYFFGEKHSWCNTVLDDLENNDKQDTELYAYLVSKGAKKAEQAHE